MKRDLSSTLMSAIRTIVNGTEPVSIATLRERLDTALLGLAHSGEVVLHRHPHPERLPPGELLLFDPEADAFYAAISLPQEENLETFATRVLHAARASTTGRWGEHKVFISHVWRSAGSWPALDDFKGRLIEANRAGLLSLSRADLVEVMDPVDVRESEIESLGTEFHFVRADEPRRVGEEEPRGPGRRGGRGAALPADDEVFAKRVLAAARASKTGRFGNNKIFISHVLRQLAAEGYAIESESVKARLVSVHQAGLLSLTRADMVEAMSPEDVDASETRYRLATFHFVRI